MHPDLVPQLVLLSQPLHNVHDQVLIVLDGLEVVGKLGCQLFTVGIAADLGEQLGDLVVDPDPCH